MLLGILVAIHPRFPLAMVCLLTRVPLGLLCVREALLRRTRLVRGWRTFALVSLVCLAGGALYEILEWWIALLAKQGASRFLAMQGVRCRTCQEL